MDNHRVEGKWIDLFRREFELCAVRPGDTVAVLSETQSRRATVEASALALQALGAQVFRIELETARVATPVPLRSTGSCLSIGWNRAVIEALRSCDMVIDCTLEGLLHAPERKTIMKDTDLRVLMISNEHPEVLERLLPSAEVTRSINLAVEKFTGAREMRVTSAAGTDLTFDITDAPTGGEYGYVDQPGVMGSWPGGLVACFPRPHGSNGVAVLDVGDVNLTFKRYNESRVSLVFEDDFVTRIEGDGFDARLMRAYYESFGEGDRSQYGISHVGWGLNPAARWESLAMYDRDDVNGTEQRAFAGSFLLSTGANPYRESNQMCHFDLPMRGCTVRLDGEVVVDEGRLVDPATFTGIGAGTYRFINS